MTIKDILAYGGYQVEEEKIEPKPMGNLEWTYTYRVVDIEECQEYTLIVTDVGFNGYGDLWISLSKPHELDEIWDLIEYESEVVE